MGVSSISSNYKKYGNSIFIFEMDGLDVLMAPLDGGMTMNFEDMTKVVKRLNASVALPMQAFSWLSLSDYPSTNRQRHE